MFKEETCGSCSTQIFIDKKVSTFRHTSRGRSSLEVLLLPAGEGEPAKPPQVGWRASKVKEGYNEENSHALVFLLTCQGISPPLYRLKSRGPFIEGRVMQQAVMCT